MCGADREQDCPTAVEAAARQLGRQLHDVLVHHLTVIALWSRGASGDAQRASAALPEIERPARQALAELRGLLNTLVPSGVAGAGPARPWRAELDHIVEGVRRAGLPVCLTVCGTVPSLSECVSATVCRIVQEALTNVMKHAGRVETSVHLEFVDGGVELTVVNVQGTAAFPELAAYGTGRGLGLLYERVAEHAGTLEAGPWADGSFRVRARLPVVGPWRRGDGAVTP